MHACMYLSVVSDEEVLGLDVPVDHVLRVAVAQGVRNLLYVLRRPPLAIRKQKRIRTEKKSRQSGGGGGVE